MRGIDDDEEEGRSSKQMTTFKRHAFLRDVYYIFIFVPQ